MCASFSPNSIVCDSSALISLADTCFLGALSELKARLGGDFLITDSVKQECIDTPLRTKSHTLPAIRLQLALNDGIIRAVDSSGLKKTTEDLIWTANNLFFAENRPIALFHKGEAETLALAIALNLENVLMDERNARLVVEDPELLGSHLAEELGFSLRTNQKYMERLKAMTSRLNVFRSSEMVVIAYEKGCFKGFHELEKQAVEAALYGVKFAGCSISFDEIEEFTRSIQ